MGKKYISLSDTYERGVILGEAVKTFIARDDDGNDMVIGRVEDTGVKDRSNPYEQVLQHIAHNEFEKGLVWSIDRLLQHGKWIPENKQFVDTPDGWKVLNAILGLFRWAGSGWKTEGSSGEFAEFVTNIETEGNYLLEDIAGGDLFNLREKKIIVRLLVRGEQLTNDN